MRIYIGNMLRVNIGIIFEDYYSKYVFDEFVFFGGLGRESGGGSGREPGGGSAGEMHSFLAGHTLASTHARGQDDSSLTNLL